MLCTTPNTSKPRFSPAGLRRYQMTRWILSAIWIAFLRMPCPQAAHRLLPPGPRADHSVRSLYARHVLRPRPSLSDAARKREEVAPTDRHLGPGSSYRASSHSLSNVGQPRCCNFPPHSANPNINSPDRLRSGTPTRRSRPSIPCGCWSSAGTHPRAPCGGRRTASQRHTHLGRGSQDTRHRYKWLPVSRL